MDYFDIEKNVEQYMTMAEGFDGRELIKILKKYLPGGSSILELGMGPGKDLDILSADYQVTGSDSSEIFLKLYKEKHPSADLLQLDAAVLNTDRRFDCLYSNKVLHHLSREDLVKSFTRQAVILNPGGILFHSFWKGEGEEAFDGLRFMYYCKDEVEKILEEADKSMNYEILDSAIYTEMETDDSFYLLLKKAGSPGAG